MTDEQSRDGSCASVKREQEMGKGRVEVKERRVEEPVARGGDGDKKDKGKVKAAGWRATVVRPGSATTPVESVRDSIRRCLV